MKKGKTAVILFNLGGPDSLENVRPFLFNLFYDKNIIRVPNPFRWLIAKLISSRRTKTAQEIYKHMGGKSPILEETEKQRKALEQELKNKNIKIFISMRYSLPDSNEAIEQIKDYNPDNIILIPLYPQFSTTTTKSSVEDMMVKIKEINFKGNLDMLCCYPTNEKFIEAHAENIRNTISPLKNKNIKILFSAHSLPEKIIKQGDPYQWQIEQTVEKIIERLQIKDLNYKITYQSKVTPVKWLGPSTEDEIRVGAEEQKCIVVVPVAFVSEHSETLVELDIEYARIAAERKAEYFRVPTLGTSRIFISALAEIIKSFLKEEKNLVSSDKKTRICPTSFKGCICRG